ncbi:ribonuclease toxin HepT-like protein [Leptothoe spongobia]|uniref:HepT-like domain-containing protein n=1 Tax=Leptothoe spongobia TAU-MAC 1115 TaxID=1967444 RepID=A0A947DIU4_9CYAN|nr:hypothetical protein [Leptothoe spongobia]MBT9318037.1 hypothetical protein [Leptothoe spongobia TAU-MAC 1115]
MSRLARRITQEFFPINAALERAAAGWQKFKKSQDELYIDSVALNIQAAYSGLERLFELIAREIDNTRPEGINWHQLLLQQMATERAGVRPPVISNETLKLLDEYRKFRHVVRHIYPDDFEIDKIETLATQMKVTFSQVTEELMIFAQFLETKS